MLTGSSGPTHTEAGQVWLGDSVPGMALCLGRGQQGRREAVTQVGMLSPWFLQ